MFSYQLSHRRIFLTLATLGLPTALLMFADPTWAKSLGVDVWNMPALQQETRDADAHHAELDIENAALLRRIEVKETLIRDLIEERTTLTEVTAQFHEMNVVRPQYMVVIRVSFPGDTDEEKMARNVISFALPRVEPEKREALERRLEAELQQMLATSASR
ncbi:MAG: hypothetical protein L0241_27835 [Planctomycetia bacterium]|nr:hypothetical protein [Planctomycetia bacterium]